MTFVKLLIMFSPVTETWQSWFNAPDLKSDEGASPPGVRIPASPPIKIKPTLAVGFILIDETLECEPRGKGFDCQCKAGGRTPVGKADARLRGRIK